MTFLAEVAEAGTQAREQPVASVVRVEVASALRSDDSQPHPTKPAGSRQLTIRVGLSFALLIGIMLGLGGWASHRSISADLQLKDALSRQAAKLQLAHEALLLSATNNRIVMQILVQKRATPELLARRGQNSQRVVAIIAELKKLCDSDKEKELILAVERNRAPYIKIYYRALQVLLEENDEKKAQSIMFEQAIPALFGYRAAWSDLAGFELQQVTALAQRRTEYDRATRHVGMALQALVTLLAVGIAGFTITTMRRDLWLRSRMHARLSALNVGLERRVAHRTEELRHAEQQLRESLAQTQEYAGEIEAVNELAKLLQSCSTLDEARQQASRVLEKFFPAGAVLLLSASRNLLEVVLSWGAAASAQGPFPPESCWGLRKGQVHLAGPHCHNPVCSHCDEGALACHLCVPMIAQGSALGVLSIDDHSFCGGQRDSPRFQRKLKLAGTLAEQISLAFANLRLRETLKYQSVRDPLTGLFNRRHMEEMLERELRRAARTATPVTVLMIDIDDFKGFNDMFGHEAGDLVLREFGLLLRLQVRGGDVACRYGGEEFLLIMGDTDLATACERAENLRRRIATLHIHYRGQNLQRITVSIGVAAFPAHASSAAQLVSAADAALYRAKHDGRDRVVVAE